MKKAAPKTQRYDTATKAKAVAALGAGDGVAHVARELEIPESTIRNWAAQSGLNLVEIGGEKKKALEELIADTLSQNLQTLQSIAAHGCDKDWQDRQHADALAVFYGVIADKTIRILEAHAAAQPAEAQP